MNVQEMHIEINLSAQKINSNYYRKLLDSEIDWLLNKSVDRFIKDRIKQDTDSLGFDATEIDLDALRTLVVLDRELSTFQVEDDATRAELPGNYSYLIDDFSNTIDACDSSNYKTATSLITGNINIYAFPITAVSGSAPFYKAMSLKLGNVNVFSVSNLPGLASSNEIFAVRDYIMNQLWLNAPANVDFYWEKYGSTYIPNNILAVTTTTQSAVNSITLDSSETNATSSAVSRQFIPVVTAGKLCCNRLVRGHFRSNLRSSAFARTTSTSPISAVSDNQIKVYHDKKFIVSKLRISYIRKPAKINLFLNQNCDIATEFHPEICDRTVVLIKELLLNPDWQVRLQDMMMNKQ